MPIQNFGEYSYIIWQHMILRQSIPSLPVDIKNILKHRISVEEEPEASTSATQPKEKKGTCKECGRRKNSNTTIRCFKCDNFTCKMHSKILCNKCINNLSFDTNT